MKPLLILLAALLPLAQGRSQSNVQFSAILSGLNEVPSNTSPNTGSGQFTLTGNTLNFFVEAESESFSDGSIHGPAEPGRNAHRIFDLGSPLFTAPIVLINQFIPGTTSYSGNLTLSDKQVLELLSESLYVNLTSPTFPRGELRGQILFSNSQTIQFTVNLSGTNERPPNHSMAAGFGQFTLTSNFLNGAVGPGIEPPFKAGFVSNPTGAFIRGPARPRSNGKIIFEFGPPLFEAPYGIPSTGQYFPGGYSFSGGFFVSNHEILELLTGRLYVNVSSPAFPHGEIRGQILPVGWPLLNAFLALDGICPPTARWKSRTQYVRCVEDTVVRFVETGFLTEVQGRAIREHMVQSDQK